MTKKYDFLDNTLIQWISRQKIFFVGSAPLSGEGHINVSPQGGDSLRSLDQHTLAYTDYAGSGAETAAHLRENGRIVLMFCAFDGPPQILRLHGRGHLVLPQDADFSHLTRLLPPSSCLRSFIKVDIERITTSCGYAVPLMAYQGERPQLEQWAERKGEQGLQEFARQHNRTSIDGLPAFDLD